MLFFCLCSDPFERLGVLRTGLGITEPLLLLYVGISLTHPVASGRQGEEEVLLKNTQLIAPPLLTLPYLLPVSRTRASVEAPESQTILATWGLDLLCLKRERETGGRFLISRADWLRVPFWLQYRKPRFNSWVRKIPWRRDRLPTPVFLGFPGSSDTPISQSVSSVTQSCPILCDPMNRSMPGLRVHHQGIFPTQGSPQQRNIRS